MPDDLPHILHIQETVYIPEEEPEPSFYEQRISVYISQHLNDNVGAGKQADLLCVDMPCKWKGESATI